MEKIVVVGSVNMDLVAVAQRLPMAGETILGTQFLTEAGGKGANQAYAIAKLGGGGALLGRVGSDDYGRLMRADLAAAGCDVQGLQVSHGNSGVALIFVADSGQNSIVVVPGANERYLPEDLRADEQALAGAQYVMLQLEIPMATVLAAAQRARFHGARVILDPAPAPVSLSQELLRYVDILTPNEAEASQLVGRPCASLTVDEARGIARQLRAAGVGSVIIKLGAQGCLLSEGGSCAWIRAPRVEVVDTTAAGDVFNAALAVACAEGASLVEACRFAVCAGALSVTRLGAQRSVPRRTELDAFCRINVAPVEVFGGD
jgi:ribokinase